MSTSDVIRQRQFRTEILSEAIRLNLHRSKLPSTGIFTLDGWLKDLPKKSLITICGETASGKTILACQIKTKLEAADLTVCLHEDLYGRDFRQFHLGKRNADYTIATTCISRRVAFGDTELIASSAALFMSDLVLRIKQIPVPNGFDRTIVCMKNRQDGSALGREAKVVLLTPMGISRSSFYEV